MVNINDKVKSRLKKIYFFGGICSIGIISSGIWLGVQIHQIKSNLEQTKGQIKNLSVRVDTIEKSLNMVEGYFHDELQKYDARQSVEPNYRIIRDRGLMRKVPIN